MNANKCSKTSQYELTERRKNRSKDQKISKIREFINLLTQITLKSSSIISQWKDRKSHRAHLHHLCDYEKRVYLLLPGNDLEAEIANTKEEIATTDLNIKNQRMTSDHSTDIDQETDRKRRIEIEINHVKKTEKGTIMIDKRENIHERITKIISISMVSTRSIMIIVNIAWSQRKKTTTMITEEISTAKKHRNTLLQDQVRAREETNNEITNTKGIIETEADYSIKII